MKAFLFAAGMGTRLKPYTDTMPKALVPVDGVPLLEHVLLKLKRSGCTDVIINLHHFADQIVEFIHAKEAFGMNISFSDETSMLLETGGAIKYASHFFDDGKPFLVHNVDILSNLDLAEFYKAHRSGDYATLLVNERVTERYLLFDEGLKLKGWTNIATGQVKSPYGDLDVTTCLKYAFAGIHVVDPQLIKLMVDFPDKFSIIDFYLKVADRVNIRAYPKSGLKLLDVGKLNVLPEAERFLREL